MGRMPRTGWDACLWLVSVTVAATIEPSAGGDYLVLMVIVATPTSRSASTASVPKVSLSSVGSIGRDVDLGALEDGRAAGSRLQWLQGAAVELEQERVLDGGLTVDGHVAEQL